MVEGATKLPVKTGKALARPRENPAMPFESLRREIDRVFDGFVPMSWRTGFGRQSSDVDIGWPAISAWQIAPAVDVAESDDAYEITAELPGMDEKNVEIKLVDDSLVIRGNKAEEKEQKEKEFYTSERRYGTFYRSFQLPRLVDTSKIEASVAKGILTIRLPKSDEARKNEKKIEVKAAG